MQTQNTVQFFRFRDLIDPETAEVTLRATLSVARIDDTYEVGFAFCSCKDICATTETVTEDDGSTRKVRKGGYNRQLGKRIASNRREHSPIRLSADEVSRCEGVFNAALNALFTYEVKPRFVPERLWSVRANINKLMVHSK